MPVVDGPVVGGVPEEAGAVVPVDGVGVVRGQVGAGVAVGLARAPAVVRGGEGRQREEEEEEREEALETW